MDPPPKAVTTQGKRCPRFCYSILYHLGIHTTTLSFRNTFSPRKRIPETSCPLKLFVGGRVLYGLLSRPFRSFRIFTLSPISAKNAFGDFRAKWNFGLKSDLWKMGIFRDSDKFLTFFQIFKSMIYSWCTSWVKV